MPNRRTQIRMLVNYIEKTFCETCCQLHLYHRHCSKNCLRSEYIGRKYTFSFSSGHQNIYHLIILDFNFLLTHFNSRWMFYVNKYILCSLYLLDCMWLNSDIYIYKIYIFFVASICITCNCDALTSLKLQTWFYNKLGLVFIKNGYFQEGYIRLGALEPKLPFLSRWEKFQFGFHYYPLLSLSWSLVCDIHFLLVFLCLTFLR